MGPSGADMLSHHGCSGQNKMETKHVFGDRCVPTIPSGRQTYKTGYIQCSQAISPEGQRPQLARLLIMVT